MANYQLKSGDPIRRIVVKTNTRNNKERIFEMIPADGHAMAVPISKEYRHISAIAPRQANPTHVLFIASGKSDKDIILNNKETIKVRNWAKQIQAPNSNRSFHCLKHEIFPVDLFAKHTQVFEQDNNTVILRDKNFGEVIYDQKNDTLSKTYLYISSADQYGHRIASITTDNNAENRLVYIDDQFRPIGQPFYKFIHNQHVMHIVDGIELVCSLKDNTMEFYFLDQNHKQCSKKYIDVNSLNNHVIATTADGKKVILNNHAQEISPKFVSCATMGQNFILQLEPNPNSLVSFNPAESGSVVNIDTANTQQNNVDAATSSNPNGERVEEIKQETECENDYE